MTQTKIDLTGSEQVQGTLPVGNGGTGATTLASGGLVVGAGTSAVTTVAPGTSGNVPTSNGSTWVSQAPAAASALETVSVISASGATTLTTTNTCYVYSGSAAATWTLPAVTGNTGRRLYIENRGTLAAASITIIPSGSDFIWFLNNITTLTIGQGGSAILVNDGTYWNILSTDLAHDVIGILPVANGGIGQANLTGLALTNTVENTPTIKGYTEQVSAMGTVGATATIPALSNGTVVTATLTTATACTFTMPAQGAGQSFVLILKQPAAGTATTATFTGVKWPTAGAPTITATLGRADILTFLSDGTNWYGSYVQGYTY